MARVYDLLNAAIFLPAGGSGRVRQHLVDALQVRPGHRVLELGCGTGLVTVRLLAAGATVVAVDGLAAMLAGARRRAPGAAYIEGDAMHTEVGDGYDRVVLSFVLHNFSTEDRIRLLRRAARALAPSGLIGVLDWALPAGRVRPRLWRGFLRLLEPRSHSTQQVLGGALDDDVPAADLQIKARRSTARGRAQILLVGPQPLGT